MTCCINHYKDNLPGTVNNGYTEIQEYLLVKKLLSRTIGATRASS